MLNKNLQTLARPLNRNNLRSVAAQNRMLSMHYYAVSARLATAFGACVGDGSKVEFLPEQK